MTQETKSSGFGIYWAVVIFAIIAAAEIFVFSAFVPEDHLMFSQNQNMFSDFIVTEYNGNPCVATTKK
jgi:hypothetical protein